VAKDRATTGEEAAMAYGLVLTFDSVSEEQYWAVNQELGIDRNGVGDYPPGLLVHVGGPTADGGWVVTEVWADKAAQGEFMQTRLGRALAAAGVPQPSHMIETDAVNFWTA
jgi:hypothetical protein